MSVLKQHLGMGIYSLASVTFLNVNNKTSYQKKRVASISPTVLASF